MHAEPIYKGATRPAMKLGIPLVPLVILCGSSLLAMMWGGMLISWWVVPVLLVAVAPVLVWMRFLTAKDDQRLRQMSLALKLRRNDHNRRLWRARCYTPTLYRGARDAWHV